MTQLKREIEPGAIVAVPVRFVARAGLDGDWAMYMGPLEMSDHEIATSGHEVWRETAKCIILECRTGGYQQMDPFRDRGPGRD